MVQGNNVVEAPADFFASCVAKILTEQAIRKGRAGDLPSQGSLRIAEKIMDEMLPNAENYAKNLVRIARMIDDGL